MFRNTVMFAMFLSLFLVMPLAAQAGEPNTRSDPSLINSYLHVGDLAKENTELKKEIEQLKFDREALLEELERKYQELRDLKSGKSAPRPKDESSPKSEPTAPKQQKVTPPIVVPLPDNWTKHTAELINAFSDLELRSGSTRTFIDGRIRAIATTRSHVAMNSFATNQSLYQDEFRKYMRLVQAADEAHKAGDGRKRERLFEQARAVLWYCISFADAAAYQQRNTV